MIGNTFTPADKPLVIRNAKPVGFSGQGAGPIDIVIGADGKIIETGTNLTVPGEAEVLDANNSYLSPGWTDIHTHIWYGGTDISLRPEQCGARHGVTTMVDAGSAGEANFHGLRELMIEPAIENVYAFLNIGSIGLVACNRVTELQDMRSIDIDRIAACVEANRDVIETDAREKLLNGFARPVRLSFGDF